MRGYVFDVWHIWLRPSDTLFAILLCYVFQGTYKVQADLRDKASNKRISCVEAVVTITSWRMPLLLTKKKEIKGTLNWNIRIIQLFLVIVIYHLLGAQTEFSPLVAICLWILFSALITIWIFPGYSQIFSLFSLSLFSFFDVFCEVWL